MLLRQNRSFIELAAAILNVQFPTSYQICSDVVIADIYQQWKIIADENLADDYIDYLTNHIRIDYKNSNYMIFINFRFTANLPVKESKNMVTIQTL